MTAPEYPLSYLMNNDVMITFTNNGNISTASSIAQMSAPASTVALFEVSGYQANMSTPGETQSQSAVGWSSWTPSNIGNGTLGLYQTGFLGGGAQQQNNGGGAPSDAGYAAPTGRHTDQSNFLFCDGHVKSLHGNNVSPGLDAQSQTAYTANPFACATGELSSDPTGPYAATMSKT